MSDGATVDADDNLSGGLSIMSRHASGEIRFYTGGYADNKKAYIRYCEHYLKTGDWIGMKSGLHEEHLVIPKCIAMAYNSDGTPKRTVGVYYPDLHAVWTKEMENGQSSTVS